MFDLLYLDGVEIESDTASTSLKTHKRPAICILQLAVIAITFLVNEGNERSFHLSTGYTCAHTYKIHILSNILFVILF